MKMKEKENDHAAKARSLFLHMSRNFLETSDRSFNKIDFLTNHEVSNNLPCESLH
jgi:hypothetical protein